MPRTMAKSEITCRVYTHIYICIIHSAEVLNTFFVYTHMSFKLQHYKEYELFKYTKKQTYKPDKI